jgi:hypothetical protein
MNQPGYDISDSEEWWMPNGEMPIRAPTPSAPNPPVAPRGGRRVLGPNNVRKGQGPESMKVAPDLWDRYCFGDGPAYATLEQLGRPNPTLKDLNTLCVAVEQRLARDGTVVAKRNRAGHRRKPCMYHWIDANFLEIGPLLRECLS